MRHHFHLRTRYTQQYSEDIHTELFNILEIFSSVIWQKIFLKYIKRSYFFSKNNFCIMNKIKPVR